MSDLKYGPDVEDESPGDIANLVVRLSLLLPGVGIRHSLGHIHLFQLTHQRIATTLADRGLLNEEVLTAIRGTRVQHLNLGPSLSDEDGLNLQGATALRAFRRPGTFTSLTALALSGACIRDSDLVHIQHLPALQRLELECIGIGNEAVFLLISLKHTLTHLDLAHNPKIDDEAIPAILIFPGLSYLSLFGTGVDMPGLRRLALVIHKEDRVIDIEIPEKCDQYISDMDHKYLIYPSPPLAIEPCTVPLLSKAALKRNLAAHALINPDIVSSGTRREMIERLLKILETREGDIVVRDMVLGNDGEED
ncbi:hypothetical protein BV22DRAFT_1021239 [Leucogyrophana mollusca]|uniref:Uncharacterized protein n=1 Tax=Leucogyrophana mollusca TaxID=85980 RepID=A0ACB8B5E0_9AGAM|nr:hypothetical protein BV22DRAFT_1021239 [Leucogyrophana mollusca]